VELEVAVEDEDEDEAEAEAEAGPVEVAEEGLDPGDADGDGDSDGVVDANNIVLVTIAVLNAEEPNGYHISSGTITIDFFAQRMALT
jgi:hypothetical protein